MRLLSVECVVIVCRKCVVMSVGSAVIVSGKLLSVGKCLVMSVGSVKCGYCL